MINPFSVCFSIYKVMPVFHSLPHGPNRDDKTQNTFTQNRASSSLHFKLLLLLFHTQFCLQPIKNSKWGVIGVNMTVTVSDNRWLDSKRWKIHQKKKATEADHLVVVATQERDRSCRCPCLTARHGTHCWNHEPGMWKERLSHVEYTSPHVGKCAQHLREISFRIS